MSGWTLEELRESVGAFRREMRGLARRMLITLGDGPVWQTLGHALFDGDAPETRQPEVFSGIGFFARPEDGSQTAEAIVLNVGGQNNPIIIATKDESIRALVDDIAQGEVVVFNRQARVYLRNDNTIEIRTHGGTAHRLALLSDVQDLRDYIASDMVIVTPSGNSTPGVASGPGISDPPNPSGTTTLKAE